MDNDPHGNQWRFKPEAKQRARFLPDHPMDPLLLHIEEAMRLAADLDADTLVYLLGLRTLAGFREKGQSAEPSSKSSGPRRQ